MRSRQTWSLAIACVALGCREEHDFVSSWSDSGSSSDAELSGESLGTAGEPAPEPEDLDPRPVVVADPPTPPVIGGSILTHSDGRTVIVSDPERDVVHVVDLLERRERAAIELRRGAQPWRAVEDGDGRVHVVLRGHGQIATFDTDGSSPSLADVCTAPRGIANTHDGVALLIACAGGELVEMSREGGTILRSIRVAPDLRDVVVDVDGTVYVTRFRRADVLTLDADFHIVEERRMDAWARSTDSASMIPNTAWRAVPFPGGGLLVAHQAASDGVIEASPDQPSTPAYYGGSSCSEIVQSTVSLWTPTLGHTTLGGLADLVLPVDVSVAPTGRHAFVVGAGTCPPVLPSAEDDLPPPSCANARIVSVDLRDVKAADGGCAESEAFDPDIAEAEAQLIAVAHGPENLVLVQQREPARLLVIERNVTITSTGYRSEAIDLASRAIEDTGDRLFHEITASRLTCASCHPEGGDDGVVWQLPDLRHTPALYAGLVGTAPFHWSGDLVDFAALVEEVFHRRMGGLAQPAERAAAFEHWVTHLRTPPPVKFSLTSAEPGRALFSDYGCPTCHAGVATTSSETVVIGDLPPLQVPPLYAVGLHPPYMHDGRSASLADAVRDMLVRTRPEATATDAEIEAIVEYLQTL